MGPKAENEKPEAGAAALRPQKRQAVKQKLDSPFVLKWCGPPKGTPATDPSAPPPASESDREPDNAPDNTAVLER
eukprot:tig00000615_g2540.t1